MFRTKIRTGPRDAPCPALAELSSTPGVLHVFQGTEHAYVASDRPWVDLAGPSHLLRCHGMACYVVAGWDFRSGEPARFHYSGGACVDDEVTRLGV